MLSKENRDNHLQRLPSIRHEAHGASSTRGASLGGDFGGLVYKDSGICKPFHYHLLVSHPFLHRFESSKWLFSHSIAMVKVYPLSAQQGLINISASHTNMESSYGNNTSLHDCIDTCRLNGTKYRGQRGLISLLSKAATPRVDVQLALRSEPWMANVCFMIVRWRAQSWNIIHVVISHTTIIFALVGSLLEGAGKARTDLLGEIRRRKGKCLWTCFLIVAMHKRKPIF